MPKYRFTYEVVETWTGYFDAENDEQAELLYRNMADNDENPEEVLPNYGERNFDIARNHEGFGVEKFTEADDSDLGVDLDRCRLGCLCGDTDE